MVDHRPWATLVSVDFIFQPLGDKPSTVFYWNNLEQKWIDKILECFCWSCHHSRMPSSCDRITRLIAWAHLGPMMQMDGRGRAVEEKRGRQIHHSPNKAFSSLLSWHVPKFNCKALPKNDFSKYVKISQLVWVGQRGHLQHKQRMVGLHGIFCLVRLHHLCLESSGNHYSH